MLCTPVRPTPQRPLPAGNMPLRQLFGVQGGPLPFPMQQLLQGVPNFSPDMSVGEFMPFMAQASKNGQLPFSPAPDGQGGVKRKFDDVQVRTGPSHWSCWY